jgi:hypothetical protein
MAVTGLHYTWRYAYGGNSGESASMQYNFARSSAAAQASLSGANGEGLCMGGIIQYRTRPVANGPDKDFNFNWDPYFGFPPSVYDDHMTSATAYLAVGTAQQGVMTLNIWFFG